MSKLSSSGVVLFLAAALCGCPGEEVAIPRYDIEVQNISNQPMSPIVAAAHGDGVAMWEEGQLAGPGIGEMAETGNVATLVEELRERTGVSAATYSVLPVPATGLAIPRFGTWEGTGPDLTDTQTLTLAVRPGDVLSLAGGLLGTNDGFWGIDRVSVPESGKQVYFAFGYDAGTEENNELEAYINDTASLLGPEPIPGDGAGGETEADNRSLATAPPTGIRRHDGILGAGDVPPSFDFEGVIVRIEVTRVPDPEN